MCQALRKTQCRNRHRKSQAMWETQGDNSEACTRSQEENRRGSPCLGWEEVAKSWVPDRCERGWGDGRGHSTHSTQHGKGTGAGVPILCAEQWVGWRGGGTDTQARRSWRALNVRPGSSICNLLQSYSY